ncbi:MAG: DNA translocase FtsK [Verrucomicrobiota bacterium]
MSIIAVGFVAMFLLALISYSPTDLPNWVPFSSQSTAAPSASGNFIGPVGAVVAGYSYFFFGAAAFLIPAVMIWFVIQIVMGSRPFHFRNCVSFAALILSAACVVEYQSVFFSEWALKYNLPRSAGGFVGYALGHQVFERFLGPVGAFIVMAITYVIALIIITGIHPIQFAVMVKDRALDLWDDLGEREFFRGFFSWPTFQFASERSSRRKKPSRPKPARAEKEPDSQPELFPEETPIRQPEVKPPSPERKIIDASARKPKGTGSKDEGSLFNSGSGMLTGGQFEDYQLPSLSILHYPEGEEGETADEDELIDLQNTIVDTLGTFGVDVEPGDITRGPTITRYELYPAPGLRVNRITSLEADIARATRAERLNILAPVPGKDTVGIEIANAEKVPVALRELFEDDAFRKTKAKLPLALGKDVYGRVIVGDLARMPHLLVAGATGSGKSVCINSIIASLLYRFSPDELRFIMVDPKVVEMQLYNDLPHMVVPVVTDPKKVLLALRWVINEMERRYALFAKMGTRNFEGFNELRKRQLREDEENRTSAAEASPSNSNASSQVESPNAEVVNAEPELAHHVRVADDLAAEGGFPMASGGSDGEPETGAPPFDTDEMLHARATSPNSGKPPEEEIPESLPYIVVIIDELADLMQTAPADVETGIARIAQKARAAGIHLIIATQTPRADLVTGIIKANVPSRIAFQVSSKMDSRIILDANGAENLVGKGDMLYLPPGSAQLVRSQGALITDEEAQQLVDACAAQGKPQFEPEAQAQIENGDFGEENEVSDEDEEIIEKCLEVIYTEKKASTSLLQRRLRLGYTRAARMIDILESRGIIGPGEGAKPREILVDLTDDFA